MNRNLKTLVTLDIKNMSRTEKKAALRNIAERNRTSTNAVVNALRDKRDQLATLSHVESMSLDNAIAIALVRVALYNARRCYHA